jgi:GR25 family glycosyltransferase involved in LPS biosynthesis
MKVNFPTYVMHYTPNVDRRKFMLNQLRVEKFNNFQLITSFDRECISQKNIDDNFKLTQEEVDRRQNHLKQICMLPEEASLCLKHYQAMLNFSQEDDCNYALFLEDDAILVNEFIPLFEFFFSKIPDDFDVGFIGQGGTNARIENREFQTFWYKRTWPNMVKCTDSLVFSKKAIEKIIDGISEHKICFPIDHEYSYWFRELQLNVYWLEPPIVSQGSQCGLFDSFQVKYGSNYQNLELKNIRNDIEELL